MMVCTCCARSVNPFIRSPQRPYQRSDHELKVPSRLTSGLEAAATGAIHSAFEIRDGGRHLAVTRVGDAPAINLDRVHASETRSKQRVALRGYLFERRRRIV